MHRHRVKPTIANDNHNEQWTLEWLSDLLVVVPVRKTVEIENSFYSTFPMHELFSNFT